MTYSLLAETLREAGNRAKEHFATAYGASNFVCESEVETDLSLKPTWRASVRDGYILCIEVSVSPISPTIQEFVSTCAARGLPIKLWVALVGSPSGPDFMRQLKIAKQMGVGVVQLPEDGGNPFELHKPVPLSLFAVRRTDITTIEKKRREIIKKAEDAFIDGSPDSGCRQICEEIEAITRRFAYYTYKKKWWRPATASTAKALQERFFTKDPWASMLQSLDERLIESKLRKKCPTFRKTLIAGTRGHTDWRNSVSHKPKTPKEREERDARLRTMYEATRDLLVDWFKVARAVKLED